jgi:hypothetical protein
MIDVSDIPIDRRSPRYCSVQFLPRIQAMRQMILPRHPPNLNLSISYLLLAYQLCSVRVQRPLPFPFPAEVLGELVVVAFVPEPGEGDEIEMTSTFAGGFGVLAAVDSVA